MVAIPTRAVAPCPDAVLPGTRRRGFGRVHRRKRHALGSRPGAFLCHRQGSQRCRCRLESCLGSLPLGRLMNQKIARFLSETSPETPCLVVDLDVIAAAYDLLARYLSIASIYYAVKRSEERRVGKECRSRGSPYH